MRDPHTSLDLFASRGELDDAPPTVVSPYGGRRPHQRSFTDILGDEPVEEPASPSNGRDRSQSPSKAIAPKIGAGKNFQRMRLFDTDETAEDEIVADAHERKQSVDPKKYQHFNLEDGAEAQSAQGARAPKPAAPKPASDRKSKHDPTWSFDDFVTPQKPVAGRGMNRARDVRHWGADNEVLENTPAPHAPVVKARRDAEAHFELIDDGPERSEASNANRLPRGAMQNEGQHLYDNRLHTADGTVPSPVPPALSNITNLGGRHRTFDPHFNMTDESPNHSDSANEPTKLPEDRKKAVRMMESNWSTYDRSPVSRKENDDPNVVKQTGIVIAGDGMGGKKGTSRGWMHGEDDEKYVSTAKKGGRGPPTSSMWDH
jgi:hypothetical protein